MFSQGKCYQPLPPAPNYSSVVTLFHPLGLRLCYDTNEAVLKEAFRQHGEIIESDREVNSSCLWEVFRNF
ncbi:hypothetical protein Tsubulata_051262 [Turnera subulata]|uniref:Uncharacterized protein n=1 Tax=Turnera subulata TaxID=218843 RepID=A0A9Q0JEQ1_9ROSI|nr:hypothetical protein Tsubulata_051262 [Turnera subulata]